MLKYEQNMMKFSYIWLFFTIYGVTQWCLNPILYDLYDDIHTEKMLNSSFNRHLPYPGLFPWNVDTLSKYIMTFSLQYISAIAAAIEIAGYDILNIILLINIYVNLQQLNKTLFEQANNLSKFRY